MECAFSNTCYTIWDVDGSEVFAETECAISNTCYIIWNVDGNEAFA